MPDRQKVEAILANRFPGAPLSQVAAAVNAIMALERGRPSTGLRGNAPVERQLPKTTIAVSTYITAPLTRVFDRFTDLDHAAEYVSGILSIERLNSGAFGVGTRWRETRRLLGRVDSAEMEVTAFARCTAYTISHVKAAIRIETRFAFEASDRGTLVAVEFSLDGTQMPMALLAPINWAIAGRVRHVLHADLADLKASLESRY
ncbi:MAG TPA: SRPBCC family protein [Vicinamibacterales bacterium]|nr:SRPBCC family protein [Vicinamibacterales bacterium]